MSVLIFGNPYSGSGRNDRSVAALMDALSRHGFSPRPVWDKTQRIEALRGAGGDLRCVIVAGGDGSVADAINDMHAADRLDVPLATVPAGTENLFAKELGFGNDHEKLVKAIAGRDTLAVDLARATFGDGSERLFTLMVSAGFDADVVHRMNAWRTTPPGIAPHAAAEGGSATEAAGTPGGGATSGVTSEGEGASGVISGGGLRRVRRISYVPRIVGAMVSYRFPSLILEVDGQSIPCTQAYVFNLPRYGGSLGIGRHAVHHDGLLDWVVFQNPGFLRLLGFHLRVWCGCRHLTARGVLHGTATHVTLRTPAPGSNYMGASGGGLPGGGITPLRVPVQVDGDAAGFAPLDVRVLPGALRVVKMPL